MTTYVRVNSLGEQRFYLSTDESSQRGSWGVLGVIHNYWLFCADTFDCICSSIIYIRWAPDSTLQQSFFNASKVVKLIWENKLIFIYLCQVFSDWKWQQKLKGVLIYFLSCKKNLLKSKIIFSFCTVGSYTLRDIVLMCCFCVWGFPPGLSENGRGVQRPGRGRHDGSRGGLPQHDRLQKGKAWFGCLLWLSGVRRGAVTRAQTPDGAAVCSGVQIPLTGFTVMCQKHFFLTI